MHVPLVQEGSPNSERSKAYLVATTIVLGGALLTLLSPWVGNHASGLQLAVQPRTTTGSNTASIPVTMLRPHKTAPYAQVPEATYHERPLQLPHLVAERLPVGPATPTPQSHSWPSIPGWELGALAAVCAGLFARLRPPTSRWSAMETEDSAGNVLFWPTALSSLLLAMPEAALADDGTGYSQASYYVTLGTYIIALPGLYSLITRSVKSKVIRRTYTLPGPNAPGGKAQKKLAGELLFYFTKKRGMELKEAGEVVTFQGKLAQKRGQAAFLTFCVFVGLVSLALVLTIVEQANFGAGSGLGSWWYLIALASPLSGKYYLENVQVEQEFKLKLSTSDDEMETEITVEGDDAEVEGLRLEYDWNEKGMVRVKGIFEEQIRSSNE